jgi:uncharacterized phiE125 gp8 family phage protein
MPLSYRETSSPAVEPVSLARAKLHLRVDFDDDDSLIASYIAAARQYSERVMQRSIYERTMLLTLDYFPLASECVNGADQLAYVSSYIRSLSIIVPKPGLVSVESITYLDNTNAPVTLPPSSYVIDTVSEPGRIMPAPGTFWPYQNQYLPGQVRVTYTSGTYGDGVEVDTCPATIKMAILLLVGHWYAHREAVTDKSMTNLPLAVDSLLAGETIESVYA